MTEQAAATPPAPRDRTKSRRAFYTLLIYTLLGPPIGGAAVIGTTLVAEALHGGDRDLPPIDGKVLFVTVMFSYLTGAIPALLTGLMVAAYEWWRRPTILAALVAPVLASGIHAVTVSGLEPKALILLVPVSLAASIACWLLTPRLRRAS